MENTKKILKIVQGIIESVWGLAVVIWLLPVAVVELAWTFFFNREKFNAGINGLKAMFRKNGR